MSFTLQTGAVLKLLELFLMGYYTLPLDLVKVLWLISPSTCEKFLGMFYLAPMDLAVYTRSLKKMCRKCSLCTSFASNSYHEEACNS